MTQLTHNPQEVLAVAEPTFAARFSDISQLTKPRITVLVALTALIGYCLGARVDGGMQPVFDVIANSIVTVLGLVVGTSVSCMGAAALNQWMERDVDALMHRTQQRPLPTGRLTPAAAFAVGLTLAIVGVSLLTATTNVLTGGLCAFTIVSYVLVYTPMKRISSISTIIGAVPGAMPPVMGYAAATQRLDQTAVVLFAILFLWQLPHFLAIAWLYREDYARAKMPMLPVIDPSGAAAFRQMLLGCIALLPLGLLPTMMGISGPIYFIGALACGLAFLLSAIYLIIRRTRSAARLVFFMSLLYLPAIYALMLADQV